MAYIFMKKKDVLKVATFLLTIWGKNWNVTTVQWLFAVLIMSLIMPEMAQNAANKA